jgi:type I restriction enzyme M protein
MAIDNAAYQKQANELSKQLWAIANDLRGNMDSTKFRNYILGMIFYRYLSERTENYMKELLKEDGISYEEAFNDDEYRPIVEGWSIEHLGYIIRPENLFRNMVRKIVKPENKEDQFNIEDLEKAINEITASTMGQESEQDFSGLFNDMKLQDPDLGDSVKARTNLIAKVITKISEIDFCLHDSQFDVLGTAYMILIGLFASDAGKKSGEFFTPTGPSKLVATLATIGLDEAKTVGDCTCGSASMLLEVQKHLPSGRVGHFYGEENNATTFNLARMNMLMHGVDYKDFDIYKGDTIKDDKYGDVKMTVQVCNPPYSLKYDQKDDRGNSLLDDARFSGAGKLPPKSHADYCFLEHMIYHMDDKDGRIAVLLPHGVLFRGGAEETIRKYIVKDLNKLDAVIGLAPNLFHGTSIPVCLLILKAQRNGNSGNIMFIDASKEFTKGKNQNTLEDKHIQKIVDAYKNRKDIERFCHVATMEEIEENDYNLNIPRYVDTSEPEVPVDLGDVMNRMKKTDQEIADCLAELKPSFDALGIHFPGEAE